MGFGISCCCMVQQRLFDGTVLEHFTGSDNEQACLPHYTLHVKAMK